MPLDVPTFPVLLVLEDAPCLVVGGNTAALTRTKALCAAGAKVTVVAPTMHDEFSILAVFTKTRPYEKGEIASYLLGVAATGIDEVDRAVADDGRRLGVFVNVVDDKAASSFILPAIFRRGAVSVAVGTDGKSPAFSRWLRDEIERAVGDDAAELLEVVASTRSRLMADGHSSEGRDWPGLIDATVAAYRKSGGARAQEVADAYAKAWYERTSPD